MLETARLILRPLDETDTENVYRMRSDEELMRYIRPVQHDRAETESWIKLVSSRWASDRIGFCAVIEKETGAFAGWCGLWRLKETLETEVGYALIAEFRGRGYALEAARACLSYGFNELGLNKIVAVARPENRASWTVMKRLGMKYDYTGRFYEAELVHYSVSKETFIAAFGQTRATC